jgi:hypothetical protein
MFVVWLEGCKVHPYVCGANLLFKPVRDNWPLRKIRELDPKSFMLEAEAPEALEPFPDVISPYIGDVPGPEHLDPYSYLVCGGNLAQLKVEPNVAKLSLNGTPAVIKGRAANEAWKARAATIRADHRKQQAETHAAEAAVKLDRELQAAKVKASSKTKPKYGKEQRDNDGDEAAARAAETARKAKGKARVRPAYRTAVTHT